MLTANILHGLKAQSHLIDETLSVISEPGHRCQLEAAKTQLEQLDCDKPDTTALKQLHATSAIVYQAQDHFTGSQTGTDLARFADELVMVEQLECSLTSPLNRKPTDAMIAAMQSPGIANNPWAEDMLNSYAIGLLSEQDALKFLSSLQAA